MYSFSAITLRKSVVLSDNLVVNIEFKSFFYYFLDILRFMKLNTYEITVSFRRERVPI